MTEPGSEYDWREFQSGPAARRPPLRRSWVAMGLVWAVVFALVWSWWRPGQEGKLHNPASEPRAITPRGDLSADEQTTIEIFKEACPSVVFIISTGVVRDWFSLNEFQNPRGAGTGFIYDDKGNIVTNHHAVAVGRAQGDGYRPFIPAGGWLR